MGESPSCFLTLLVSATSGDVELLLAFQQRGHLWCGDRLLLVTKDRLQGLLGEAGEGSSLGIEHLKHLLDTKHKQTSRTHKNL